MIENKKGEFHFVTDWKWFYILPTFVIQRDEIHIAPKTFRIVIHLWGWHISWLWTDYYADTNKYTKSTK